MPGSMTLRNRLILLVAVTLAGMAVLAAISAYRSYADYRDALRVSQASRIIPEVERIAAALRGERGLNVAVALDGPARFQSRLLTAREKTDQAVAALRANLDSAGIAANDPELWQSGQELLDRVDAVVAEREQAVVHSAIDFTIQRYSAVIDQAQEVLRDILLRTANREVRELQTALLHLDRLLEGVGFERAATLNLILTASPSVFELQRYQQALGSQPAALEAIRTGGLDVQLIEAVQVAADPLQYDAVVKGRASTAYGIEKITVLPDLHHALGMGGLIHNFKNYVLRGEPEYVEQVHSSHRNAVTIMEQLLATPGVSNSDRTALAEIRRVTDRYLESLPTVTRMLSEGHDTRSIDAAVKIDDTPIEAALEKLGRFSSDVPPLRWWDESTKRYLAIEMNMKRLTRQIETRLLDRAEREYINFLLVTAGALALALVVLIVAIATYRRLIGGVNRIVDTMTAVASTGNLEVPMSTTREDEIGQMADALQRILDADRALRDQALKLSRGEAVEELSLRSDSDQLAAAMNTLNRTSSELALAADRIASGNYEVDIRPRGSGDVLGTAMRKMAASLRRFQEESRREAWVREGQIGVINVCTGEQQVRELADAVMGFLPAFIGARSGVMYARQPGRGYVLCAEYAFTRRKGGTDVIQEGQGLVGQAIRERSLRVISDLPEDYFPVGSVLGASDARHVVILPLVTTDAVPGVLEFAFFEDVPEQVIDLLQRVQEALALALTAAQARSELQEALETTQKQAEELRASEEELQAQAEELRASNEELEAKTAELEEQSGRLRASEEELQAQSEELREANEELEQKASALEEKTQLLNQAKEEVEARAAEVEQASRYKSDFLANMSHELRTPLNSMLILSKDLQENSEGNLNEEEVECASVIHESGSNLLRLINDILDLSKIEAGKIELQVEAVSPRQLGESLQKRYAPVARERDLEFEVELDDNVPDLIRTDPMRYEQIITNLISNGLKFTHAGGVYLRFTVRESAENGSPMLALAVRDTGIGIGADKQEKVFRAFEQADGSTSRQYGGTGLGLAISREMAHLLGGELELESEEGKGSTFHLTIPFALEAGAQKAAVAPPSAAPAPVTRNSGPARETIPEATTDKKNERNGGGPLLEADGDGHLLADDRERIRPGEACIVIVEDDPEFARILLAEVRERGLRGLVAHDGPQGVELVQKFLPIGVLLDIGLPGADGWWVMSQLKKSEQLRHIPVHFLSASDESKRARSEGAVGYFRKPVSREDIQSAIGDLQSLHDDPRRRILVVEDDPGDQQLVRAELQAEHVEVDVANDADEALRKLQNASYHCIVLDLKPQENSGSQFLERAESELGEALPPVVVHSGSAPGPEVQRVLQDHGGSVVSKTASFGQLQDEVALFLHSVKRGTAPAPEEEIRAQEPDLAGHAVLVVDDDMRNTFSLSRVFRKHGLRVFMAQDGERALKQLHEHADDIDVILMDIVMPGMDGYETIRRIRQEARFKNLPVIAVTAKAMAGDREKCLEAGANDYLSKPLDTNKLLDMIRTWLA